MIKVYEVNLGRYNGGTKIVEGLDEVKRLVYDVDRYLDYNGDEIDSSIDDYGDSWSYNGRTFSATELLRAIDEDWYANVRWSEAEDRATNMLPEDYDEELENLELNGRVTISETNSVVTLVKIIPESEEEAEEIGNTERDLIEEATGLW